VRSEEIVDQGVDLDPAAGEVVVGHPPSVTSSRARRAGGRPARPRCRVPAAGDR
jgi:hypothetical protein